VKSTFITFIAAILLLFSLSAWSASTKQEIIELRAQVEEMQKDLAEIKKLLKEGARAPRAAGPAFKEQVISIPMPVLCQALSCCHANTPGRIHRHWKTQVRNA